MASHQRKMLLLGLALLLLGGAAPAHAEEGVADLGDAPVEEGEPVTASDFEVIEVEGPTEMVDLFPEDADEYIAAHNGRLAVLFYVAVGPVVKENRLWNVFQETHQILSDHNSRIVMARFVITDARCAEYSKSLGLEKLPSIAMFGKKELGPDGKPVMSAFVGDTSDPERLAEGLSRHLGAPPIQSSLLGTEDLMKSFLSQTTTVLGVFTSRADEELDVFLDMAEKLGQFKKFGHTFDADLVPYCKDPQYECDGPQMFVVNHDAGTVKALRPELEFSMNSIVTMIIQHTRVAGEYGIGQPKSDPTPADGAAFRSKAAQIMVVGESQHNRMGLPLAKLSKATGGKVMGAFKPYDTEGVPEILETLGLDQSHLPVWVLTDVQTGIKYVKANAGDFESMQGWYEEFGKGQLTPHIPEAARRDAETARKNAEALEGAATEPYEIPEDTIEDAGEAGEDELDEEEEEEMEACADGDACNATVSHDEL